MRRLTFLAALLPLAACAQQTWVKATSAHFEVYTTAGEQKAREAILRFEHVNSFFEKAFGRTGTGQGRVRVIAFQSAREYRPYQIAEGRPAYAGGGRDQDRIVMDTLSPERYPAAIHEYVHILLERYRNVPLWFNEGLADVYATLRPAAGGKVVVGDVFEGRLAALERGKWLDLPTLCAVDRESPYYSGEQEKASIFYAESWLLVHMLFFGEKYGTGFSEFRRQILAGTPAEDAFQSAFGKTMWHVESDLRRYAEDGAFHSVIFSVSLEKSAGNPEIQKVSAFESSLMLANILADINHADAAKQAFRKLAEENPASPEVPEGLAFLAWRRGDLDEARAQFGKAMQLGSKDARVYYGSYALEERAGGTRERQVELLRKAIELDPDYQGAHLRLGYLLLAASDYSGAAAQFAQVQEYDPQEAFRFFRAFAYACHRAGDKEAARVNARRAAEAARTPEDKASVEQLQAAIEGRSPQGIEAPAAPALHEREEDREQRPTLKHRGAAAATPKSPVRLTVEGTLDQIDCLGKTARVRLTTVAGPVRLLIEKPESVEVRGGQAGAFAITCGPQKPQRTVRIEYDPKPSDELGTAGVVRSIEIK